MSDTTTNMSSEVIRSPLLLQVVEVNIMGRISPSTPAVKPRKA
jgi:hypothetical protein